MVVQASLVTPALFWGHSTVPVAPTAPTAVWTCWVPLPRWSPGLCYMEWPHFPMSPWLQCFTYFPMP